MQTKLGQLLRKERETLKMSQREFANYIGMPHSTYERVENDRNDDIKLDCVIKILSKVNVPIELFIPIDILKRYYLSYAPQKEDNVTKIVKREISKFVKKMEYKLSRASKL
jgi:transcriptional regulator with XRE-family HTH domain